MNPRLRCWMVRSGLIIAIAGCYDPVRKDTVIYVNSEDAGDAASSTEDAAPDAADGAMDVGVAPADAVAVDGSRPSVDADPGCPGATEGGQLAVDLQDDPQNCGACGNKCTFPNGTPLCQGGLCRGGVCSTGYRDLDRDPANGCECRQTGTEICDGVDNDCDGLVDASIVAGVVVPACACTTTPIIPVSDEPAGFDSSPLSCGMTFCQRHAGSFALNYCCDVGIFAQCHVDGVNLNQFDADHGGHGILEVSFCVSEAVDRSMVHLWYGVYPFRKALPLVGTDAPDLALSPGCYVRYFSPQDALCAAFNPTQLPRSMPDGRPFPAACVGPAPQFYTWACPGGRWGDADPSCVFDYDDAPLWITVENCVGPSASTVSIESVKLLDDDCVCLSDESCRGTGRPVCASASVASPSCPASNPRCAGVCAQNH